MKVKRCKTFKIADSCCNHYLGTNIYDIGWVMLPCFKLAMCRDCATAVFICNDFLQIIFEYIFAPFWSGRVHLFEKYPHGFVRVGNRLHQLVKGETNA